MIFWSDPLPHEVILSHSFIRAFQLNPEAAWLQRIKNNNLSYSLHRIISKTKMSEGTQFSYRLYAPEFIQRFAFVWVVMHQHCSNNSVQMDGLLHVCKALLSVHICAALLFATWAPVAPAPLSACTVFARWVVNMSQRRCHWDKSVYTCRRLQVKWPEGGRRGSWGGDCMHRAGSCSSGSIGTKRRNRILRCWLQPGVIHTRQAHTRLTSSSVFFVSRMVTKRCPHSESRGFQAEVSSLEQEAGDRAK